MPAEDYWVYHNRQAAHRGAIIHRGDCRECRHGRGKRGGTDPQHGAWHGPYRRCKRPGSRVISCRLPASHGSAPTASPSWGPSFSADVL